MSRWTDIAGWVGPTVNEGDGDGRPGEPEDRMAGHVGLVVHIAEGTYDGTEAWERNPVAEVSSHFVVARDGRVAQMVDTDDRSWCQGAGNASWLSVENEGYKTQAPTAAQVEALAQLYARCMTEYGAPAQLSESPGVGGLGWHGMGGAAWGGHYDCPGEGLKSARPAILARALEIANGDDDVALTDLQIAQLNNTEQYAKALVHLTDTVEGGISDTVHTTRPANEFAQAVRKLAGAASTGGIDVKGLATALAPLLLPQIEAASERASERAVRKVLGAVDGATPAG